MAEATKFYGTGRRKTSVARVWLRPGAGAITVNRRAFENYFPRETLRMIICQPLQIANVLGQVDVLVNVGGGGPAGQAGAVRHGIARALLAFDDKLVSAALTVEGTRIACAKRAGEWVLEQGEDQDCNTIGTSLFDILTTTKFTEWIPDPSLPGSRVELQLQPPIVSVSVRSDKGKPQELAVGTVAEKRLQDGRTRNLWFRLLDATELDYSGDSMWRFPTPLRTGSKKIRRVPWECARLSNRAGKPA